LGRQAVRSLRAPRVLCYRSVAFFIFLSIKYFRISSPNAFSLPSRPSFYHTNNAIEFETIYLPGGVVGPTSRVSRTALAECVNRTANSLANTSFLRCCALRFDVVFLLHVRNHVSKYRQLLICIFWRFSIFRSFICSVWSTCPVFVVAFYMTFSSTSVRRTTYFTNIFIPPRNVKYANKIRS